MINQYEQPAQQNYVDPHVDLPIQTMSMLAEAYKNQYEQAQQQFQNYVSTYGDFTSPIANDVNNYNQQTVGRLQNVIGNLHDPEWLKTPEGQAAINNVISTTNYNQLAQYKQSAENASEYLKAAAAMQAQGKYNPQWDQLSGMNPNKWNTSQQGIFNYTAPIEYKDLYQLGLPYYANMKPGDIGYKYDKQGLKYIIKGISKQNLQQTAEGNYNNYANTPQGQMYLKMYKQSGMSDDQAAATLKQNVANAQLGLTMNPTTEVDQGSLAEKQNEWAWKKQQAQEAFEAGQNALNRANSLEIAGLRSTGKKGSTGTGVGATAANTPYSALSTLDQEKQNEQMMHGNPINYMHRFALNMVNNLTHPNKANGGRLIKFQQAMDQPVKIGGQILTPRQILGSINQYNTNANLAVQAVKAKNAKAATNYTNNATAIQAELGDMANRMLFNNAYSQAAAGKHSAIINSAYQPFDTDTPARSAYTTAVNQMAQNMSHSAGGVGISSIAESLSPGSKADKNGWFPLRTGSAIMPEHLISTLTNSQFSNAKSAQPITNLGNLIEGNNIGANAKFRLTGKVMNYTDTQGNHRMAASAYVKIPYDDIKDQLTSTRGPWYHRGPGMSNQFSGIKTDLQDDYGANISDEKEGKNTTRYIYAPVMLDVQNGQMQQEINLNYLKNFVDKKQVGTNYDPYALDSEGIQYE